MNFQILAIGLLLVASITHATPGITGEEGAETSSKQTEENTPDISEAPLVAPSPEALEAVIETKEEVTDTQAEENETLIKKGPSKSELAASKLRETISAGMPREESNDKPATQNNFSSSQKYYRELNQSEKDTKRYSERKIIHKSGKVNVVLHLSSHIVQKKVWDILEEQDVNGKFASNYGDRYSIYLGSYRNYKKAEERVAQIEKVTGIKGVRIEFSQDHYRSY